MSKQVQVWVEFEDRTQKLVGQYPKESPLWARMCRLWSETAASQGIANVWTVER